MTTQEIREMLDSTITANGKREISGKSLNAAFNSVLDYLENYVVTVDYELDASSQNPIANSTVAQSFEDFSNKVLPMIDEVSDNVLPLIDDLSDKVLPVVDEVQEKLLPIADDLSNKVIPVVDEMSEKLMPLADIFNSTVIIPSLSGGYGLRGVFEKYKLNEQLDRPLACLVQQEDFMPYSVANMVVEAFDSSLSKDGQDVYKVTFFFVEGKSKVLEEKDGKTSYAQYYTWSSNSVGKNISKSYLYTPSTKMVQSLGVGSVSFCNNFYITVEQGGMPPKESLQIGNTYYLSTSGSSTLVGILVCVLNKDGVYEWRDIKDNKFTLVY